MINRDHAVAIHHAIKPPERLTPNTHRSRWQGKVNKALMQASRRTWHRQPSPALSAPPPRWGAMNSNGPATSAYFGRKLRDQNAVAVSDDDQAIANLLEALMSVESRVDKPVPATD